jgi:hypothetical protein
MDGPDLGGSSLFSCSSVACTHLSGLFDPDGIRDTAPKHLTLFADSGHSLDFINKAFECLDRRFHSAIFRARRCRLISAFGREDLMEDRRIWPNCS